mgnify:CR=1 FL=1
MDRLVTGMRFVQKDFGGSFSINLPTSPDSGSVSGSVYAPGGGELGTATVTVDTFATTLATSASLGALQLTLSSGAGASPWAQYLVDGPESQGGEMVTFKAVSGSTATLLRPLIIAHSSGATVAGVKATVSISAAQAATLGRHHRVKLSYLSSGVEQEPLTVTFDVTRYSLVSNLNLESLRDLDPTLTKKIPAGTSWIQLKESTWRMILNRVAQNFAPGALVGTIDLTDAHGFLVRSELALNAGAEFQEQRDKLTQRFQEELDATLGAAAFDNNQDGVIAANEGFLHSIRLSRG